MYLHVILTAGKKPCHYSYSLDPYELAGNISDPSARRTQRREERGWSHLRGVSAIAMTRLNAQLMAEHVLWVEAVGVDL